VIEQSRDKLHNDLINRTECLEGNGKEMIIAGDSLRVTAASAADAAEADDAQLRGGHSVSNCDVPNSAISGCLLSDLRRPCSSLMDGKLAWDSACLIKSFIKLWRWARPGFRL